MTNALSSLCYLVAMKYMGEFDGLLTAQSVAKVLADNLSREVKLALKLISEERDLPSEVEILDLGKIFNNLIAVFRSKINYMLCSHKTETDLVILQ